MFLIEKLPKEDSQATDEPMRASVMLSRTIAAELAICLSSPWTPAFCKENGTAWSGHNFWMEVYLMDVVLTEFVEVLSSLMDDMFPGFVLSLVFCINGHVGTCIKDLE